MADVNGRNTTAYFETREAADAAVNDLEGAGIPKEQISVTGTGVAEFEGTSDRSFWEERRTCSCPPRTATPMPRGCDAEASWFRSAPQRLIILALLRSSIAMARSI